MTPDDLQMTFKFLNTQNLSYPPNLHAFLLTGTMLFQIKDLPLIMLRDDFKMTFVFLALISVYICQVRSQIGSIPTERLQDK